jgi:integrase
MVKERKWKTRSGEERSAWVVDYRHNKKRYLKSFTLKRDAVAYEAQIMVAKSEGTFTPVTKLTIEGLLDKWIDDCLAEKLERSTVEQRRQHARLHIVPRIGQLKLATLTTPAVNHFADQLRDAGMSQAMRQKVLVSLRSAVQYGQDQGWVAQNVAAARRKRRKGERHVGVKLRAGVDFPTKEELGNIIAAAPDRWRAFFITAIFTGMRASELRGLRWKDVDLDIGAIHVRQRADAWGSLGSPKSKAGTRIVPLVPLVVNTLKPWHVASGGKDLVFCTRSGKPFALTNIRKTVWVPLLQHCGCPQYGFHSLRHAAASLFIEQGWQPKRVQDLLGHSSITMTFDRYGHLFPQSDLAGDLKKLQAAVVAA